MGESNEESRTFVDRMTPEHILFLVTASDAMEKYHKANGRYAPDWNSLGMGFTYIGGYEVGDPEAYPPPGAAMRWKPKRCTFTYQLSNVSKNAFEISARRNRGTSVLHS